MPEYLPERLGREMVRVCPLEEGSDQRACGEVDVGIKRNRSSHFV